LFGQRDGPSPFRPRRWVRRPGVGAPFLRWRAGQAGEGYRLVGPRAFTTRFFANLQGKEDFAPSASTLPKNPNPPPQKAMAAPFASTLHPNCDRSRPSTLKRRSCPTHCNRAGAANAPIGTRKKNKAGGFPTRKHGPRLQTEKGRDASAMKAPLRRVLFFEKTVSGRFPNHRSGQRGTPKFPPQATKTSRIAGPADPHSLFARRSSTGAKIFSFRPRRAGLKPPEPCFVTPVLFFKKTRSLGFRTSFRFWQLSPRAMPGGFLVYCS